MKVKIQYAIYPQGAKRIKWRTSKSFLKNFCTLLKMCVGGSTARTGYYSETGTKNLSGSNVSIVASGNSSYRFGGRDPRIHVGNASSPTTPTPDDYKLNQEVANFSAACTPAEGQGVTVSGNQSLFDVSANVTFSNQVTVTEIGLSSMEQTGQSTEDRFMLIRDVVSPPVTIPANTPYIIRYRIIMEA
jgi:hypothetical protein